MDVRPGILDLFWNDILFTKLLPFLSIMDLFRLRGLSRGCKMLVDSYFQKMKRLNLGPYWDNFTINAFRVLSNNCVQLRELMVPKCGWLTDDLIIPLFENNKHLTKIVLNDCNRLTSVCLQPVIINCKNLKYLSLSRCSWLTEGCLQSITLHQHNLQVVDLRACVMVNKLEAINNFLAISHKIKVLNISKLTCVNDTTLTILAHTADQLEMLNICECCQVTSYGISMVLEYCRRLRSVLCSSCPLVTQQALRVKIRPNQQVVISPDRIMGNSSVMRIMIPNVNV